MKEFSAPQAGVAAFFDLDGTLTSGPTLEWRYFQALRKQGKIAGRNYLRWLREAARLAPQGIGQMRHANKMYLQGVASDAGMPAPAFLRQALDQVAWHARQGHLIVMASGTLEPLARHAAERLEQELARRGIGSAVRVFATCLEQRSGTWTGRIAGKARMGAEKADALRALAAELNLNLARCYGYGDTASDAPMLAMVGRPAVVNASQDLQNIARRAGWAEISWDQEQSCAATGVRPGRNRGGPAAAGRRA